MPDNRVASAIVRRAALAGVDVAAPLAASLSAYLALLARWNRTINLTALDVAAPTDEAVDRLIVEPLAAAPLLRERDRSVIDIGSGGGSPAIPLKLARPDLRFLLVEMKARKSAFLREAIRELTLESVAVETMRVEELATREALKRQFDVVTLRAVRADADVFAAIDALLSLRGRVFWFGGRADQAPTGFRVASSTSATVPVDVVVLSRVDG